MSIQSVSFLVVDSYLQVHGHRRLPVPMLRLASNAILDLGPLWLGRSLQIRVLGAKSAFGLLLPARHHLQTVLCATSGLGRLLLKQLLSMLVLNAIKAPGLRL